METGTPERLILLVEDRPDRVRSIALDNRDRVMDFLDRQGEYTQSAISVRITLLFSGGTSFRVISRV